MVLSEVAKGQNVEAMCLKGSKKSQSLDARKEEICTSQYSHKALKRSEVPQCLNSGKEEISAALERREGWQAGYFSADRTFGDREVETYRPDFR